MESNICPVCGNQSAEVKVYDSSYQIECNNCGKFYIHKDFFTNDKLNTIEKNCIYYYLIHDLSNVKYLDSKTLYPYFIINENDTENNIIKSNYRFITYDKINNIKPKNISDQIDFVMLNLAQYCMNVNGKLVFHIAMCNDAHIEYRNLLKVIFFIYDNIKDEIYSNENDELYIKINNIIDMLKQKGYLYQIENGDYKITIKGWEHINKLQKTNKIANQAFVAMWFDPEMEHIQDTIKQAIEECGYIPIIINQKDHNNQIVPEIFHEIKKSLFVVADLCGHRGGVYYEAGYAEALGKEVIITCREDYFNTKDGVHDGAHFDVKQKSAVIYKDNDDLKDRLIKRITATVGLNK